MSCVVVLPSIVPEFTAECIATIHPDLIDHTLIPPAPTWQDAPIVHVLNGAQWTGGCPDLRLVLVYNTPDHNLGCAQSWNLGIDEVIRGGYDWLVILSAGVRFGDQGGIDFLSELTVAQRGVLRGDPAAMLLEAGGGLGWHLIAFSRPVLEIVGRFDPIFHPAYYEDNDWSYRYQLATGRDSRDPAFVGPLWPKVDVDAQLVQTAHGILRSGVTVDFVELETLYRRKWGGVSPHEVWKHPYNDPSADWTHVGGLKTLL